MSYLIDDKRVAHQEVDGEVIAIDFVRGIYFSMRGTAGEIWQMLSSGAGLPDVIARYRGTRAAPADLLEAEIGAFVAELVAADLVEENRSAAGQVAPVDPAELRPYETPRLETFEDMAHLIVLDPVHDVGPAGWPHTEANGP